MFCLWTPNEIKIKVTYQTANWCGFICVKNLKRTQPTNHWILSMKTWFSSFWLIKLIKVIKVIKEMKEIKEINIIKLIEFIIVIKSNHIIIWKLLFGSYKLFVVMVKFYQSNLIIYSLFLDNFMQQWYQKG